MIDNMNKSKMTAEEKLILLEKFQAVRSIDDLVHHEMRAIDQLLDLEPMKPVTIDYRGQQIWYGQDSNLRFYADVKGEPVIYGCETKEEAIRTAKRYIDSI